MKAVLISIQPKWCELIASGKKTIEVRKTRPKMDEPFLCYIYATKPQKKFDFGLCLDDGKVGFLAKINYEHAERYNIEILSGKVIGEFLCHNISEFESELWDDETYERITRVVHTVDWEGYPETESYYVAEDGEDNYLCRQSCLTWEELRSYVGQDFNTFFGWHISDLKIYDKPKELSEFSKYGFGEPVPLKRPPQSWMYVEDGICP